MIKTDDEISEATNRFVGTLAPVIAAVVATWAYHPLAPVIAFVAGCAVSHYFRPTSLP